MNRRRNDFDNKNYADIMQLYKLNNEMKTRIEQLERIVQFLEEKIDTIEKRNVENSLSLPEDIIIDFNKAVKLDEFTNIGDK